MVPFQLFQRSSLCFLKYKFPDIIPEFPGIPRYYFLYVIPSEQIPRNSPDRSREFARELTVGEFVMRYEVVKEEGRCHNDLIICLALLYLMVLTILPETEIPRFSLRFSSQELASIPRYLS